MSDTKFYGRLDSLRKLRNRVHIQNIKNHFEPNEYEAFTESRKIVAEKVLEKTLKTMATKYPRNLGTRGYVKNF